MEASGAQKEEKKSEKTAQTAETSAARGVKGKGTSPESGASEKEVRGFEAAAQAPPGPGKAKNTTQFSAMNTGIGGIQGSGNISRLMDLELPIAVELGRIRMLVKDILDLGPGAVVELNKFSGEPVDVYVNNKKFAEGEVVVVDQNFGVRITALVGPSDRLPNLK